MIRHDQLCNWLQTLTPREEYILRLRFGMGADASHPLRPDGDTSPFTDEQAQQLERQGSRHLRNTLPMINT